MAIRTGNKTTVPSTDTPTQTAPEVQEPAAQTAPEVQEPAAQTAPEVQEPAAQTAPEVQEPAAQTTAPEKPAQAAPPPAARPAMGAGQMVVAGNCPSFTMLNRALDPEMYGNTFPRIVPGAGQVQTDSKLQLGPWIDIQVVSISDRWMMAPDVDMSQDQDSKVFCRASYDNATIPDREGGPSMTYADWEREAAALRKAAGKPVYDKWRISKYLDVFGIVVGAEAAKNELATNLGMVQVSVSSTVIKQFNAFFMQGMINVNRGKLPADKQCFMRVRVEARVNARGQNYPVLVPELIPMTDIVNYQYVQMG